MESGTTNKHLIVGAIIIMGWLALYGLFLAYLAEQPMKCNDNGCETILQSSGSN